MIILFRFVLLLIIVLSDAVELYIVQGPYSQKVSGLNVLYKSVKCKPNPWLSPFVNTSPGHCSFINHCSVWCCTPQNASDTAWMSLTGNENQIWFDKGLTYVVYDNGVSSAGNLDHTAIDAMVGLLTSLSTSFTYHWLPNNIKYYSVWNSSIGGPFGSRKKPKISG